MTRVAMSEGDLAQASASVAGEGRASPAEGEIAVDCRKLVKRFAGGSVVALDARTGKTLYDSRDAMPSWVHFSGLAVANGRVYTVDHDSKLYCFGLKGK